MVRDTNPYLSMDNELDLEEESQLDFCQSVNITILVVPSMKISHIRVMSPMYLTQRSVTQRLSPLAQSPATYQQSCDFKQT